GRREKDDTVPPQRTSPISPLPREVKFSNLDKVFWPEEKYTNGDLIEYYRSLAPWLLPYLKDRPLVLTRYPDGINGQSFCQTYAQCLQLAMLFARLVTDQHPDIATTARTISKRDGKVYVDAFQNRAGQLMVAPYSVRPSSGAPVSMPLEWDEVNAKLHNSNFTIANALKRMQKLGQDPVVQVLE